MYIMQNVQVSGWECILISVVEFMTLYHICLLSTAGMCMSVCKIYVHVNCAKCAGVLVWRVF